MVDDVRRSGPLVPGTPPVRPPATTPGGAKPAGPAGGAFAEALRAKLDAVPATGLHFSRHAQERLQASGRSLTPQQARAVEEAVDLAAAKGARDSLVLLNDLALVVSVRNRTVITAVSGERMREQVFTNIDSAVIVGEG